MYDVIGDIHGHATSLKQLLTKMDYHFVNGVWLHPARTALFVGDYIDRGPEIRETLQIVRTMVKHEKAIALMGNHEYNALAYAFKKDDGTYLRMHNNKNSKQHKATLEQFESYADEWQSCLEWFYTLPLSLEKDGLRAVHACWDPEHIDWLRQHGHDTMSKQLLVDSHNHTQEAYTVINDILKGKEFNIPAEYAWADKDGNLRRENRYKWWRSPVSATYGDFLFNCPDALKSKIIEEEVKVLVYPEDEPPVFFGHYWLEDEYPVIQRGNVICLDYSVAKEGYLAGYRWNGERELMNDKFVFVKE